MEIKTLEDLYNMQLHTVWQANKTDFVIRVPGGWVYKFNNVPLFVPEPHPILTYHSDYTADLDSDDVVDIIEQLEEEENEKKSVSRHSVHSGGEDGGVSEEDLETQQVAGDSEGDSETTA